MKAKARKSKDKERMGKGIRRERRGARRNEGRWRHEKAENMKGKI